jgi:hypothetical protein
MRFEIARGKAFGALALHRTSRNVLQKSREKPLFMETLREIADGPIFLEAGGQIIRGADGHVIGAIGVTGDVNEVDDICAIEGIRRAGLRSDDDFSPEDPFFLEAQSQRLLIDTPANTVSRCCPQPLYVTLPHLRQLTRLHICFPFSLSCFDINL